MEQAGELLRITSKAGLESHLLNWETDPVNTPIGYVLSLEGADSLVSMKHLERAWESGLRALGPAHYGEGVYAFGTDSEGPLGPKGRDLLTEMMRLGIILDVTHLCDQSLSEALEFYDGPLWASHNNCRKFVPHNRQFSDEQIKRLIERDAVICAALDAWMLVPGWVRGVSEPATAGAILERVADNIDNVCQLAGDSLHAGIGSDLDGAFGREQSPADIDTIADLQKIPGILRNRGYSASDISNILSGNLIRFLQKALPGGVLSD
ncbi:MAG: membrane dipeptidase [Bacteroidales bacterium]|nr:membrane dipeptidase [Bacteroidales bacterium]